MITNLETTVSHRARVKMEKAVSFSSTTQKRRKINERASEENGRGGTSTERVSQKSQDTLNSYTLYKNAFKRYLHKYFTSDTKFELNWKEFFCFIMCLQVPLPYIMKHVTIVKKWGATLVLSVYIVTGLTISMPVYMVYMFLGNYSKRCYVKFWECVPLLKGLAYSIAISNILMEIYNVAFAGMAVLYMSKLLQHDIPWLKCDYKRADPTCVPLIGEISAYNKTCCDEYEHANCSWHIQTNLALKYSTFDYYHSHVLKLGYREKPIEEGLLWRWVAIVEVLWVLIFFLMAVGIRRIRFHLTNVNIIIGVILLPLLILTLIISPRKSTVADVASSYDDFFKYSFWLETCIHTLHIELPGDVITFSALSKSGINSTMYTNLVYAIKLLFLTVLTVWVSNTIRILESYYKVKHNLCLQIEGDILLFSAIPDLMTRWPMPRFWLFIHFLVVFFWGFLATVYVMNSFLEALLEEYPMLLRWRFLVCAVICILCGILNAYFLQPDYMITFRNFTKSSYVLIKVTLLMVSLWGLFLYKMQRFKNDYHFTYRTNLSNYWVVGIKIALLLVTCLFCVQWSISSFKEDKFQLIILTLTLAPLFIGIIVMSIKLLKSRTSLLKPDPNWGPPTKQQKLDRSRFDPTHELHYRFKIQCEHNCLTDSPELRKEIEHWRDRKALVTNLQRKIV